MNRGQIRTMAARFCNDPNLTRFSTSQYNTAIDTAQEEFCYDSQALYKDASTFTVVDGTATYDLPSDFWLEKEVTHKGLPLKPISRHELLKRSGEDWTDDTGTPTHFIIDPEEARKQIRLYPTPTGNDTGANLILTYYPVPAAISADGTRPFNDSALMVQFHRAVAAHAAADLLLTLQQTPDIAMKVSALMKIYTDKVDFAREMFGNTASAPLKIRGHRNWLDI